MSKTSKNEADMVRFRELLDSQNEWPASYLFKFIVPRAGLVHLEKLFPDTQLTIRASRKGTYVSVSINYLASSSDIIVEKYEAAAGIEGVISL